MKAQIRLATDQFCYIEFSVSGTTEEIIAEHEKIKRIYRGGQMEEREFNIALDRYLTDGTMDSAVYEDMSTEQKSIIQCIKKSVKRMNSRNIKK